MPSIKDNQYFINEIIVEDNKGNLYYLDSDYINENFKFDPGYMIPSHLYLKMRRNNA